MCYASRLKKRERERERGREKERETERKRERDIIAFARSFRDQKQSRELIDRRVQFPPFPAWLFFYHPSFSLFLFLSFLSLFLFLCLSHSSPFFAIVFTLTGTHSRKEDRRRCSALCELVLQHASRIKLIAIYGYAPPALLRHIKARHRGIY